MEHRDKRKLYLILALLAVFAAPFVTEFFGGHVSPDVKHLLLGVLIGLAIVFIAASARNASRRT